MTPAEQRLSALAKANGVRMAKAVLKDEIRADPTWATLVAVIRGERGEAAARLSVAETLTAAPAIGPRRLAELCSFLLRSPWSTAVGDLCDRERGQLVVRIMRTWGTKNPDYLARVAASARPGRKGL